MLDYWLLGIAMMLVIEGLLPFTFPDLWRDTFRRMIVLTNGQLRFAGIISILSGLMLLYWVK